MKCKQCNKTVEFPIYEEEVRIIRQPCFGPNAYSTTPTGKTIPVCPFCDEPLYDDLINKDGIIQGPRALAEEAHFNNLRVHQEG